ncbi:MAG: alpha-amylase family glycosyl hydrolase [Chthoniobacterales bacterium]
MKTIPLFPRFGVFLFAAVLLLSPIRAQSTLESYIGWMPMQPAAPGTQIVLDLHRFFFARPGDELEVKETEPGKYTALFDRNAFTLRVRLDPRAAGLVEIPLKVTRRPVQADPSSGRKDVEAVQSEAPVPVGEELRAVMLVAVQSADGHNFTYRPAKPGVKKVNVAGQFNGWNTGSHEMKKNEEGVFELFVNLPAGAHPYKLVVDGEWTTDPANPEQQDDGTGSRNSIVRVAAPDRGKPPVVFAVTAADGRADFRVVTDRAEVAQVSSVLQRPDGTSVVVPYRREGNLIRVETGDAPEGSWVRVVAADASGNVSNAARVPVKPSNEFRWQDGIIYYAFTDRFANGEADNDRPVPDERVEPQANYQGGDFQGIRRKIDEGYFRDLGVNVLWLAPLNRNPDGAWQEYIAPFRWYTGYHGYWPVSPTEVEPRFGGESALVEMIRAAHGDNMFIIADLVLKHVHVDHPLYHERPELFGSLTLPDGSKNLRKFDEHQFTTWFEEWLPAFDFDKPEAVKFLLTNAVDFARRYRLDGYRLDAVKHIKRSFWWRYRVAMRTAVDPGRKLPVYSVGETFMDREGIMSFVGPNMLDGQFDFPLYDTIIEVLAKQHAGLEELEKSLAASELIYGKETLMSPLLGNHDKARFMAYADGDLPDPSEPDEEEVGWKNPPRVDHPAAYARLKLGLTFLLSIDGVPMIYYGDEIGLSGAGDPDNRRMMRWDTEVTAEENSVREHFRKVAAARQAHPALRYGSRRALVASGDRYAFVRAHLGDVVLAVWNRGEHQTEFKLEVSPEMPDGTYVDAISGSEINVKNGRTSFKVEPMQSALFGAK